MRKLLLAACAASCLTIGGATFASAAPVDGIVQTAPAVDDGATSQSAPLLQKVWWHHCWHCWHWHRWHWHRWHRW